jgi:hypothetical protein
VPFGGQPDVATSLRVLGGVGQQVQEDLGQPGRVGVEVDRLGRQRDRQFMGLGLDGRAGRFHGTWDHRRQVNALLAELQFPPGDAGNVE